MPGPDITRPKSERATSLVLFLTWLMWAGVAVAVLAQPVSGHAERGASHFDGESIQAAPGQAGSAPASPASSSQQQTPDENGTFVIRKDVDEVLLHATVVDDKQHIVTNLDRNAFSVFEDGKAQNIISFRHEDIPVAMGILIDNSGSMREKRAKVNAAALNLVRSSNPQDEVFDVNFNVEEYHDQDFTNDL